MISNDLFQTEDEIYENFSCRFIYLFININQLDALKFIISLFQASTCFEHMCSSSGGPKLYYKVSGIITPISVMIPEVV